MVIWELIKAIYNVEAIILWGGLLLIAIIIFVETGLFFGFFLPGDSLLVTAGIFASLGYLNLWWLLLVAALCAIAGDQLNYYIGRKAGKALFAREDSRFFKRKYLIQAQEFYKKYGPKTIVLARFVPGIRTFAPAVAGAAEMDYHKFVTYNILGGLLWVFGTVFLGYFLAASIPNAKDYLHLIIGVVILISFIPIFWEYFKARRKQKEELKQQ